MKNLIAKDHSWNLLGFSRVQDDASRYMPYLIYMMPGYPKLLERIRTHPDICSIDGSLSSIYQSLMMESYLTPTNHTEQYEIFLHRGGRYCPQYIYNFPDQSELDQIQDQLISHISYITQHYPDHIIASIYISQLEYLIHQTKWLGYIAVGDISSANDLSSNIWYMDPVSVSMDDIRYMINQMRNHDLYQSYLYIYAIYADRLSTQIGYDELVYIGSQICDSLDLGHIDIVMSDIHGAGMATYIGADQSSQLYIYPRDYHLGKAIASIYHELSHIYRHRRSLSYGLQIANFGISRYVYLDEGLAQILQYAILEHQGYDISTKLSRSYTKYQYISQIWNMSFQTAYEYLADHRYISGADMLRQGYYQIYRSKMGLTDTNVCGYIYPRDQIYYVGLARLYRYMQDNLTDWIDIYDIKI